MDIKEIEKKLESGNYIAVANSKKENKGHWYIFDYSRYCIDERLVLIHKKHKDILNAYLEDNSVEIWFKTSAETPYLLEENFIKTYDETIDYYMEVDSTAERISKQYDIANMMANTKKEFLSKEENEVLQEKHDNNLSIDNTATTDIGCNNIVPKQLNNFAEFGFEADFEGEILKHEGEYYYGIVDRSHYTSSLNQWRTAVWNKYGICDRRKFNLTPIKKAWYEDESNIGKLIVHKGKLGVLRYFNNPNAQIEYLADKEEPLFVSKNDIRPATEAEAMQLVIKE